jgi:uncharacterized protein YfeS|tara:strand:- start:47 stop:481 length:435 start_codon:yes stop_codon:yes gene_type:complete
MKNSEYKEIKMNETLDILDRIDTIGEPKSIVKKERIVTPIPENEDEDLESVRKEYYQLIDNGKEAIDGMLTIAENSEHPRAYEVVGQLIKVTGEMADKLRDLKLEKQKIEVLRHKAEGSTNVTNNAIFLGSTKELQELMKKKND